MIYIISRHRIIFYIHSLEIIWSFVFNVIETLKNIKIYNPFESSCEYVSQKCTYTQQVKLSWQYDDGTHFLFNNKSEGYEKLYTETYIHIHDTFTHKKLESPNTFVYKGTFFYFM